MKRTNLVLDEQLLDEATRLAGEKTFSAVVNRALDEFVRRRRALGITKLFGTGLWKGDLAVMREDKPRRRRRPG